MTQILNDLKYVKCCPECYSKLRNRYCHRFTYYPLQSAFLFGNKWSNHLSEQGCVAEQFWSDPPGGKKTHLGGPNI